jgi:hypothetical protein
MEVLTMSHHKYNPIAASSLVEAMGGYEPGFLMLSTYAWSIYSHTHHDTPTKGVLPFQAKGALSLLKDDGVRTIVIEGSDNPLTDLGIEIGFDKGPGVASKRLARVCMFYSRIYGKVHTDFFTMHHGKRGVVRSTSQDGLVQVSRHMLKRMAQQRVYDMVHRIHTTDDPLRREKLWKQALQVWDEACTMTRGEITVFGPFGLIKGHAMITESEQYDVRLAEGSEKKDITWNSDQVFFAIRPANGHEHGYLDRQSLVNLDLNGFFRHDPVNPHTNRLFHWLVEWLQDKKSKVLNGQYNESLRNSIMASEWEQDAMRWLQDPLHEYIASGGDVRWFRWPFEQALKRPLTEIASRVQGVNGQTKVADDTKGMAFPIPLAYLSIAPCSMSEGHARVRRGQCQLDYRSQTLWVNDVDYTTLGGSFKCAHSLEMAIEHGMDVPSDGIQARLGGCDGDDHVWTFLFCDVIDGKKKALVWRSPNDAGEYVLLTPNSRSDPMLWLGNPYLPVADSRRLPTFDVQVFDPKYAILPIHLGKIKAWTPEVVNRFSLEMRNNAGALGGYVKVKQDFILAYGRVPKTAPATMEEIVDATVKTMDNMTQVKQYVFALKDAIGMHATIPERIAYRYERFPDVKVAEGHWYDKLHKGAERIVAVYRSEVDKIVAEYVCPPEALFDAEGKWGLAGRDFRSAYGRIVREYLEDTDTPEEPVVEGDIFAEVVDHQAEVLNLALQASHDFMSQFDSQHWPAIMMGGLAGVYSQHVADQQIRHVLDLKLSRPHDGAFFQRQGEDADGDGLDGFFMDTMTGLRQLGILGVPVWNGHRLVVNTNPLPAPVFGLTVVKVRGCWYNWAIAKGLVRKGTRMGAVPKDKREEYKERFALLDLKGTTFAPVQKGDHLFLCSKKNGLDLGTMPRGFDPDWDQISVTWQSTDGDTTWLVGTTA